jgi:hypothetical protein
VTIGHSCTKVATSMVEEQGCLGRSEVVCGAEPLEQQSLRARPQQSKHPGEGPGWKRPRGWIKNSLG